MQNMQDNALIASRVAQLMERHGVPKQKQTRALSDILLLSFAQAHRKMRGQSTWTFSEIRGVADAYGEPVFALVDPREETRGEPSVALLDVGTRLLTCLAWIGDELKGGKPPEYVALRVGELWRIYPHDAAPIGQRFAVDLIEIRPKHADSGKPSVAIVDDDLGDGGGELKTADTICLYLNERGFDATAYYDAGSLRHAMRHTVFDAYVLDWLLGSETAEAAIKDIRASDKPRAPIFLLTGQLDSGNVDESDIARVMTVFDVNVLEKPARLPLLAAELNKRLNTL
ncbi:hypothetical protein Bsp3421_003167 [Burkholderia sp. FERM BP-3421]|jgi:hypothetical protein|uniref:helix-turn-helix domain-containing protein n=1 Tax=Burkholderia sp. FERM BP-3421 TaxID=1494466 RepID=UPI00235FA9EF|nr:helix-turn-helix domain-containing protein [Burkholderia sp. FERM BP-3421]WDD93114.1 hypothetical protein Bsp3421_003167 [Burkholderia sp. FERM BP-3421]